MYTAPIQMYYEYSLSCGYYSTRPAIKTKLWQLLLWSLVDKIITMMIYGL